MCIYHANCADGFGAAWAVRQALPNVVDFYPANYDQEPPDVTDRDVIIVDFSYPYEVLAKMADEARQIFLLDHHENANADLSRLFDDNTIIGQFDLEKSGAILAWEFFHPGKEPPQLLKHIEDRDLWRFDLPGTREITADLFSYPYDFEVWDKLMSSDLVQMRIDGTAITRKHHRDIIELTDGIAHRMIVAGHDVPAINVPHIYASDAGHVLAAGEKFAACYYDTGSRRKFSLRSHHDGMDVAEIAKKYGGNGHKHAAGFSLLKNDLHLLDGAQ
ncbi:MAG: phosphohydrolase [endosymbiont of Escarpia spicata]|uniref:Phosphohydrolase n=1 Tax=endosymbiont of Escarpia spicata TaxID=2200908 RepID=A0A370DNE2_9GAMM|nr:MAG: phosphohydrolase [endosymbiont of Escarpia spicata]